MAKSLLPWGQKLVCEQQPAGGSARSFPAGTTWAGRGMAEPRQADRSSLCPGSSSKENQRTSKSWTTLSTEQGAATKKLKEITLQLEVRRLGLGFKCGIPAPHARLTLVSRQSPSDGDQMTWQHKKAFRFSLWMCENTLS